MFQSRNIEGEMLPPTRAALLPHIIRVNYIAMRDKSYVTQSTDLLVIEANGWPGFIFVKNTYGSINPSNTKEMGH